MGKFVTAVANLWAHHARFTVRTARKPQRETQKIDDAD
jgi:hypothetical protein